jgi:alpha-L-fucosidase
LRDEDAGLTLREIPPVKFIMKNSLSRRGFIKQGTLVAGAAMTAPLMSSCASWGGKKTAKISGPFQPTWESLAQNYQCPDWFRDAKFGIWAHWSAQCVPEQGDWYARRMYMPEDKVYDFHLKTYGHPSKFGFMEIDNLWKAENWQPEKLMELYVRAGAKYFVALANHHDNFDNYDSKYHEWNSTRVGPKKDLIGTWAKTARRHGLRFGVTNHSAHAWHWFQVAYGYDGDGPMAGVRYDAYGLSKADGKGKWWDGLDPQELYTGPQIVMPDGLTTKAAVANWHRTRNPWSNSTPDNPHLVKKWFLRCQDLVDKYHPDLLYFDNNELPFGQTGLDLAAHFYNASFQRHGKTEVVINGKQVSPAHRPAMVEDYERGFADGIQPQPWQTDTCIGGWHYDRSLFENHKYKTVGQVARMLVDIVSKNGNLLLNIPVKGDGTIDSDEIKFLNALAAWMDVNSEGIFGSRPWKVFGEGPTKIAGGMFNENRVKFGAQDIRFTTKGRNLYAYFLGWPDDGKLAIQSLGKNTAGKTVATLSLLGSTEKISWTQDDGNLRVTLPATKPCDDVFVLKLTMA